MDLTYQHVVFITVTAEFYIYCICLSEDHNALSEIHYIRAVSHLVTYKQYVSHLTYSHMVFNTRAFYDLIYWKYRNVRYSLIHRFLVF